MKKLFLLLLIASCRGSDNTDKEQTVPHDTLETTEGTLGSMKGFEVRAWEKEGKLMFTLLPGTNREKTMDEVYSEERSVEGLDSIRHQLSKIARGEYVLLKPVGIDTMKVTALKEYLVNRGLEVSMMRQTGF